MVDFLFLAEPAIDEAAWQGGRRGPGRPRRCSRRPRRLRGSPASGRADALHAATQALADARGRKLGKAQAPIRVAVTGRRVGPPLFESMEVLGREAVLARLVAARDRLGLDPS